MLTERMPELASIEAFVEYLIEDERKEFTLADCQILGEAIHLSNSKIRAALEDYGFLYAPPQHGRTMRGFKTNSHDRWSAYSSHGGSGGSSIISLAGAPEKTH